MPDMRTGQLASGPGGWGPPSVVAQVADHWGTRYTADGKVVWAEQPLAAAALV